MPKRIAIDEDIIDISSEEIEDISNLELDIQDQMNSIFMEVGQDSRDEQFQIRVYKVIEKTGERGACFSALPSEMPGFIERIQQGFGAGIYEIWIYKNKRIFKRFKQSVLEPRKVETPVQDMRQDLSVVMKSVVDSNKQQFDQLKELMLLQNNQPTIQPTPQINMMEMMQGMVSMMAAVQGMIPKPESGNQFEMFLKAADFVKSIGGDSETTGGESNGWDGMMKLADKFGPGLIDMTSKISEAKAIQTAQLAAMPPQVQPPPVQPSREPRPNPVPASFTQPFPEGVPNSIKDESPIPQQSRETEMKLIQQLALKKYIVMLCQKAAQGSDPILYGELIIDNIDEFPQESIDVLLHGDIIDLLCQFNTDVLNHKSWFEQLTGHVRSVLVEPEESEPGATARNIDEERLQSESEILTKPVNLIDNGDFPLSNSSTNATVQKETGKTDPIPDS